MIPTQIADYAKITRRRLSLLEQRINNDRKDLALRSIQAMRREVDKLETKTIISLPAILDPQITPILNYLTQREATIICLRYGLLGGDPQTLDAVGQLYGVTRERVRQVESKAISKLQHPTCSGAQAFLRKFGLDNPHASPYQIDPNGGTQ